MRKLDRNRRFGTTFGDHPCRFRQDGRWFNQDGDEVDPQGRLVAPPPPPPAPIIPTPAPPAAAPAPAAPAALADDDEGPGLTVDEALGADKPGRPTGQLANGSADPRVELRKYSLEALRRMGKKASAPSSLLTAKGTEAREPLIEYLATHTT